MIPHFLLMFPLFAKHADIILASKSFQSDFAEWTHKLVKKQLNTSIIAVTFDTVSLKGCASACTWSTKEAPAPSFNFEQDHGRCHCNNATDDTEEKLSQPEMTYGILQQDKQNGTTLKNDRRSDCYAYFMDGFNTSGFYKIRPSRDGPTKDVHCDMDDGGWTAILIRLGPMRYQTETFNRGWTDYVNGFGVSSGQQWIGLEVIHQLTKQHTKLRVIGTLLGGDNSYTSIYSTYSEFTVESAASNYTLYVSGFDGNCGDALSSHNGRPFSVPYGDNECANECACGWWYGGVGNCGQAVLTRMEYGDGNKCPIWATCGRDDTKHPVPVIIMEVKPI